MTDWVVFYNGPAKGLYEYENFKQFMLGLMDVNRAVRISTTNNEEENLEGRMKQQIYHVNPSVTLDWTERPSEKEHCMVSLYGPEDKVIEVMELLQEMERIHQYLRAMDTKNLRNLEE